MLRPSPPPSLASGRRQRPMRAVFCVPRSDFGVLSFAGPDAQAFLQGQLSNDVAALAPGSVQPSSYNSPKGRMLATLFLWRHGSDAFHALVAADVGESLRKRLSMYVLRAKVAVSRPHAFPRAVRRRRRRRARRRAVGVWSRARPRDKCSSCDTATLVGLPDGRIVVVGTRRERRTRCARRSPRTRATVAPDVWRWLGIRAGVPTIAPRRRTCSCADRQLGPAGRREFPEGLLSRAGNRRAHAIPRAAQGAAAPVPRRRAAAAARHAGSTARSSATRPAAPSSTPRPRPAAAATSSPSCS